MAKILLVEDDTNLADSVVQYLKAEHHVVETTESGEDALQLMKTSAYDVVILDIGLPDKTGIEVLTEYRNSRGGARVLILTGKDKIEEKEQGFDAGADDYLTKPFHIKELAARVRALLRRPAEVSADVIRLKNLELNPRTFCVTVGGTDIQLTRREMSLLEFFMRYPNQVFSSESLLTRVWQSDADVGPDTIKTYINRLRTKLGDNSAEVGIKTVHGVGYMLESK
ncbi:MAG TPA: response regulator transcription factor [Candidatus Obscuribacterales bacterium]